MSGFRPWRWWYVVYDVREVCAQGEGRRRERGEERRGDIVEIYIGLDAS